MEFLGARIVGGHRFYDFMYNDNNVSYPSVTTMLKVLPEPDGLKWFKNNYPDAEKYTARRAMIGTTCHYFFECQCAYHLPDHTPEMEEVAFAEHLDEESLDSIGNINRKIKSIMKQHDFKPISLEDTVWSDVLKVAGRVDYRGMLNGKKVILDLKTAKAFHDETKTEYLNRLDYMQDNDGKAPPGFFSKFALQLSTYKQCYKERFGWEAEELWILRVNENNKPELRLQPDVLDDVKDVREMYYETYGV